MTHGFFAVMGGFMLFEKGKKPRTLNPFDGLFKCTILPEDGEEPHTLPLNLEDYVKSGVIDITEAEIQDKSQGDILSKGLVIVQTGWFILQCIARRVQSYSPHPRSSSLWLWHSLRLTLSRMDCGGRSRSVCAARTGWSWAGSQWMKGKKRHSGKRNSKTATGTKACGEQKAKGELAQTTYQAEQS